ncbi:retrovirus-related Pol polyprotein from transposon 17.6 [Trichonephila clavipes]|nr:retrovirus-related Pol polyprotein from transposon 17.6 [Trichonephila clavipes]
MVCLEEIAAIANILKTAPTTTVQFLHKIVNDEPYSKSSRKELKKFAGFPQNYDIEARKDKILKDFTKTELITVCTILGLNCVGSAKELSSAKTFIQTLHNILTYSSLKAALIEEFEDLFCSYDVHKEMQKRKLRPTESLFEYFLAMREIASKAYFRLDDQSLIMYCVSGIPDSNHNKLILYACKSISEFKEKLKIYEKVFMQNNSYSIDNENKRTNVKHYDFPTSNKNMCSDNKFHNKDQFYDANVNKRDERICCGNCGLFNHTSNECYHKNKGLKCFNCNQFGHKSFQCVFKKPDVKHEVVNEVVSEVVNDINSSSEMRKIVKINGYDFDALIDTGSTITLIREGVYQILERPTLNATKIKLTSFNKLHKLEEANLEKVDKLVKLEKKYEILQETFKITEKRLVEKEIQCKSLTEKILIVNALTESNDNPKTSMSTKEQEIKPSKRKTKLKSSGRNANKTSHSDENQALAKEKNDLLRQIDFLNSIILYTKMKEPNKSKAQFFKKRRQLHIYKKDKPLTIKRTQFQTRLKLRPNFYRPYLIKTVKPHDRYEVEKVGQHEGLHLTSTAVDFMKRWSTADA